MEKQKGLLRILTIPKSQRCLSLLWLRTTMHLWPESGHSNLTGMLPWCEQHREMQKFEFLITTEVELVFCILQGGLTKCKQMTGYFILESVFRGIFTFLEIFWEIGFFALMKLYRVNAHPTLMFLPWKVYGKKRRGEMHIVSDYSDQMPNFSTFTLNFLGTKLKKKNSFPFLVDFLVSRCPCGKCFCRTCRIEKWFLRGLRIARLLVLIIYQFNQGRKSRRFFSEKRFLLHFFKSPTFHS